MNLQGYNANEHEPVEEFKPIPAGEYTAMIVGSGEISNDKGWTGLSIKVQVVDGEHKGSLIFTNITMAHATSTKAIEFGKRMLGDICRATGILNPRESSELHNKPVKIKVKITPAKDGFDARNDITKFEALNVVTSGDAEKKESSAPWLQNK